MKYSNLPMTHLSPHFRIAEMACNHCGQLPPQGISEELLEVLEAVRSHFDAPVTVNSGYRCPAHNKNVGGASRSQHLYGKAADIRVSGVVPAVVQDWLKEYRKGKGGLGSYHTSTHIDVGPDGRRWRG